MEAPRDSASKLNEMAEALTKQDGDSSIVVDAHTDSKGASAMNQDLSPKRADSVRSYLVPRGIAAGKITDGRAEIALTSAGDASSRRAKAKGG